MQRITQQLDSYGLAYTVFPATANIDGAHGLRLTMARLFESVTDPEILVLEDDCCFLHNPVIALESALPELPTDYDLLFLGGNVYKPAAKHSEHLYRLTACVGNHAVVYTRAVMDKMAALYKQATKPTDMILDKEVVQMGNSFIVSPLLATQYPGYSDIEQKETDYKNLLIERYNKNVG